MRTLADVKRAIRPGVVLEIDNRLHPHLNRQTTVVKAQTKDFSTELSEEIRAATDTTSKVSWTTYPKAADVVADGDSFSFLHPESREPWITFTIIEAAS